MVSIQESETIGVYLPIIAELYGEKARDQLVAAAIEVEEMADLPDPFGEMLFVAQSIVDGTYKNEAADENGDGVAKTFSEALAEAGQVESARSFTELLAKYNPYHDPGSGRFTSSGASGANVMFRAPKKPWDENSSMSKYLSTGPDGKAHISKERQQLYNEIINKTFEGVEKPAEGEPRSFVFMGGGGASGKSYLLESGYVDTPPKEAKKAVHINADDIKDMLPEYREMLAGSPEVQKEAASYVHQESSIVATQIVKMAVARGYNVVLDGTASNVKKTVEQANEAHKAGYKVDAHYVQCPMETALAANEQRFQKTGRYVPTSVLVDAHQSVSKNFGKLANMGIFDHVDLVQNDRKSPLKTIASAEKGGKLQVHDQVAYDAFESKQNFVLPKP